MKEKLLSKVMLLLAVLFVGVGSAVAADKWVKTAPGALATGDVVVIVDLNNVVALPSDNGSSKAPAATSVEVSADKGELTSDVTEALQWVVTVSNGSYQFNVAGTENYLYCTKANNGVRVGTNDNNAFTIFANDGVDFLVNTATNRYIGVYNTQDWRCYTTINNNIKDCVTAFYKKTADDDTRADAGLSFSETSFTVAPGADFTAPTLVNPNNLTVTYSSNNEDIAIVDETTGEVVVGDEEGVATITASFAGDDAYKPGSASYTITVFDANKPGASAENPYTVAQALAFIETLGSSISDEVYVKGIISQIDEVNTDYGNATYWISDDGSTTSAQLEVYRGYSLNGERFEDEAEILVGDNVIVVGKVVNFRSETPEFTAGSKIVSLTHPTVEQKDAIILVEDSEVAYGETFTVDAELIEGGAVTVTSSNPAVATVEGLVITPVAVGKTTITVATEENTLYYAGEETFVLTVTAPQGLTEAPAGGESVVTKFTDKNLAYEEGGLAWEASPIEAINSFDTQNGRGVQFGANKGEFTLTASPKGKVLSVAMTMSTNGAGNTVAVSVGDEAFTIDGEEKLTLTKNMKNETVTFVGEAEGDVVISVNDAEKSVYFLDITITTDAGAYTETVALNASGYATYASKYPLDFTDAEAEGFSAWEVTEVSGSTVTFNQVTGAVKGGQGVLLKGEAKADVVIATAATDSELEGNLLVGTLAPTYVEAGEYFGLSGENFVAVNAGTVKAGKALLPAAQLAGVKALTFVFNGTDGVQTIESVTLEEAARIFDLAGRRLAQPTKGINIVNGKKLFVK